MEFALVLPLLLLVLVGMYEVGRLVHVRQVLDNAVREGARQASIGQREANGSNNGSVELVVKWYLEQANLNVNGLTVQVTGPSGSGAIDPRALNASTSQTFIDQFKVIAELPFDRLGNQGNRLVHVPFKLISLPRLTSRAHWFSMKDFPLQTDVLAAPVEL